jgi:hypothetical protein
MASTEHNQIQSPLFRLPGELRNKIYGYVFQADSITMRAPASYLPVRNKYWFAVQDLDSDHVPTPLGDVLRSMTVCRQYYAEIMLIPFALNTLSDHLEMLGRGPAIMPKELVEVIATVQISFGYGTWDRHGSDTRSAHSVQGAKHDRGRHRGGGSIRGIAEGRSRRGKVADRASSEEEGGCKVQGSGA